MIKQRQAALALQRDPMDTVQEMCTIVGISRTTYYIYVRSARPTPAPPATADDR
jgi:ACT domain-containing protein